MTRAVADRIGIPDVDIQSRNAVGAELQQILVDLLALSLTGKQAHWHVTGQHFRSVHEQLDEIVGDARTWSDNIAERSVTLGVTVDGRANTIVKGSTVEPFPEGWVHDADAVRLMTERIAALIARLRERLDDLGRLDLVTRDLVLEVVGGLEKHLWMLQAQEI